ncbi:recombinase family protein [Paenibacillus sp. TAB 01]|uniref:recombinase family protein n=1 Tax=Paenibacillus sp. TAB 01 TaxID=3368988 RepID=UPI00375258F9
MAVYCVGYVRVSVDKTGEKVSPEQQADAIRSFAHRNGWEVYEIYRDIDVSGGSMVGRPEFNRMLMDIQKLNIKTIVFWNLSRYTRDFFDFIDMTRQLQAQQVNLWTAEDNNNIDLRNWNYNSMYSIFKAMFAHQQREDIRATVKANFNKMVADGHSIGSPAMFALKKCKIKFRIGDKEVTRTSYEYDDMEKVELVRLIYKMYTEDNVTDMEIVRFLNQNYSHLVDVEAVKKYRKGKAKDLMDGKSVLKWNKSKIVRILSSTQATGYACKTREKVSKIKHRKLPESEWIWSNNFLEGKEPDFPPLVDLETWFKAQHIRKSRNPKERKEYEPRRFNSPYLLSGLLRCGCCSYAMTGRKERGSTTQTIHHYYYCRTHSSLGAACDNKDNVPCRVIDDVVLRLFGNTATILAIIKTIAEHQENNKDREQNYINKLSGLENRIRVLNDEIEKDMDSFRYTTSENVKRRFMESIDEKENELQKVKKEKELFVKGQESASVKKINLHELVGMLLKTPELIADEQRPVLRRYLETIIECVFYYKDKVVIHLKFAKRDIRVEVDNPDDEKVKKAEFEKQQRLIERVKGNIAEEVDHRKLLYMLSYLWDKKELTEDEGTVLQTVAYVLEEYNKRLVEEAVPFDLAGIASKNAENGDLLVIPAHPLAHAAIMGRRQRLTPARAVP